jgi:drug/metabolite transporter (DMT)-like permease
VCKNNDFICYTLEDVNIFINFANIIMNYWGEIISLGVSFSWTITALASEVATKRLGVFVLNVWRMLLALLFSGLLMWYFTGNALPLYANGKAWMWLLLSGVVGYFIGDRCLFNSYIWIGSRYGQLFMTLAPMAAAFAAWISIGQTLTWKSLVAMAVTLLGIAISVLGRGEGKHLSLQLPIKGVLFGIGAGVGQGVGLVLSKIGLDYYTSSVPADILPSIVNYLPFGANLIRCIAGFVCFSLWLIVFGDDKRFVDSFKNHKGMAMMLVAVIFGPFLGVGFSLMAVQYTAAGIASTIMATTPILILIPSHYFFHQKITIKGILGAIISVVGVSLFFLL